MVFYNEELHNNAVSATHPRPILLYSDIILIYNNVNNTLVIFML